MFVGASSLFWILFDIRFSICSQDIKAQVVVHLWCTRYVRYAFFFLQKSFYCCWIYIKHLAPSDSKCFVSILVISLVKSLWWVIEIILERNNGYILRDCSQLHGNTCFLKKIWKWFLEDTKILVDYEFRTSNPLLREKFYPHISTI
jgi:hypothetical protein